MTPDTIVQSPNDPQTLNRYSYCGNNPVNNIDPSGHSWFSKAFKAIGKFFSNLVGHPVQTLLAVATVAVGVVTGNPFLIASETLQYVNVGTSSWQGGGWSTFHQVTGHASIALATAGKFYTPSSAASAAPSAELGYDGAGRLI